MNSATAIHTGRVLVEGTTKRGQKVWFTCRLKTVRDVPLMHVYIDQQLKCSADKFGLVCVELMLLGRDENLKQ